MTDMPDRPKHEAGRQLLADATGPLGPLATAELGLLADVLADPSTWVAPRPGLEDAVLRAVVEDEPPTMRSVAVMPIPTRRASRRRRTLAAALAAAMVIGVVVAIGVAMRGSTAADYQAQLHGTASMPAAGGSVEITQEDGGFEIVLDAAGLPALREGEYYQAWLVDATGTLVPIGTFSSSESSVTFWSGVSPQDYPTMTVTIEAPDGDQTSSGRRVLAGRVRGE